MPFPSVSIHSQVCDSVHKRPKDLQPVRHGSQIGANCFLATMSLGKSEFGLFESISVGGGNCTLNEQQHVTVCLPNRFRNRAALQKVLPRLISVQSSQFKLKVCMTVAQVTLTSCRLIRPKLHCCQLSVQHQGGLTGVLAPQLVLARNQNIPFTRGNRTGGQCCASVISNQGYENVKGYFTGGTWKDQFNYRGQLKS